METFSHELLAAINACYDADLAFSTSEIWNPTGTEEVLIPKDLEAAWLDFIPEESEPTPVTPVTPELYREYTPEFHREYTPELLDPTPDLHALFRLYDHKYFEERLQTGGTVAWSNRLKVSAGMTKRVQDGTSFQITLSAPLLQFRSRNDLVATLLHEMIHAYLGMTRQCDNHGPTFQHYARTIGTQEGVLIPTMHSFQEEVDHYKSRSQSRPNNNQSSRGSWRGRGRRVSRGRRV